MSSSAEPTTMAVKATGLAAGESVAERIERFDWTQLRQSLNGQGNAVLQCLLSADEARVTQNPKAVPDESGVIVGG